MGRRTQLEADCELDLLLPLARRKAQDGRFQGGVCTDADNPVGPDEGETDLEDTLDGTGQLELAVSAQIPGKVCHVGTSQEVTPVGGKVHRNQTRLAATGKGGCIVAGSDASHSSEILFAGQDRA